MISDGRVARTVAAFSLPPAVILGLVAGFAGGAVAGVVVFVLVAAALGGWALRAGDGRVGGYLAGREADPERDARLCNLVEGMSITAGLREPRIVVVEAPGLNLMAAGTKPEKAVLAVTSGLLNGLDRIELEAVLAEGLTRIRRGDTVAPTVAVATFGLGRALAAAPDLDMAGDQAAVALTRYPPALASALEKIRQSGAEVPGQPAFMAHLWLVDPRPGASADEGRLRLRERIEALREL